MTPLEESALQREVRALRRAVIMLAEIILTQARTGLSADACVPKLTAILDELRPKGPGLARARDTSQP